MPHRVFGAAPTAKGVVAESGTASRSVAGHPAGVDPADAARPAVRAALGQRGTDAAVLAGTGRIDDAEPLLVGGAVADVHATAVAQRVERRVLRAGSAADVERAATAQ